MELFAIGWVTATRADRQDDDWDAVAATITLDAGRFTSAALVGLTEFSHVEILYVFDRLDAALTGPEIRHPRGNPAWPAVGIFAQRASKRPNRLGATVCELLGVTGTTLSVRGLDALDGTPVVDIKPYMTQFGARGEVRQPAWSDELMDRYWEGAGG